MIPLIPFSIFIKISFIMLSVVFFAEFLYTPGCINQFLFTRKKRMAFRTNFNFQIAHNRMCLKCVPASTSDRSHFILRVNTFFHLSNSLNVLKLAVKYKSF